MTPRPLDEARVLDVVGVGECMVEFHATEPLASASTLVRAYGGDVLNALTIAARLGARTGFVTRVGQDPFGPGLRSAWQRDGIDTKYAPLVPGENGVYFISVHENGEREFTYRRAGSAAAGLTEHDVPAAYVASSRVLLLSGITQAISQAAQAATLHAARAARAAGTLVAYDPNYRPKLWDARGGERAARHAYQELAPLADLLLPSYPADLVFLSAPAESAREAAVAFARHAARAAVKAGDQGAWLADEHGVHHAPATRAARVLDTTGAGDAWNGAFLHALISGRPSAHAAEFANAVAAWKLQFRGAIPPRHVTPPALTPHAREYT